MRSIYYTAIFFTCSWLCLFLPIQSCRNNISSPPSEEEINRVPYLDRLPEIHYNVLKVNYFTQEIVSNGKIMAREKADLRFTLNEIITQIYVSNGQWISKGTIIARLDNSKLMTELYEAQQALEEAIVNLKDELITYHKSIEDTAALGKDLFNTIKIRSGFLGSKNSLSKAKRALQETVMRAPFNGVVANLFVKPYNLPPSDKPFCTLVNMNTLDVEFTVLETELQWVGIEKPTRVMPYSYDTVVYHGKITEVNPLVDQHGMITIKAQLANHTSKLLDGMHVKVVTENIVPNQLIVPKDALVLRDGREVVFTYKGDSTVYWNYVKSGLENSSSFTIVDGLKPGDSVVVAGNLNLAHMTKVKINEN